MRECDMSKPVMDWIADRGYTPYAEVRGVDIIGVDGARTIGVEMKLTFTRRLRQQGWSLYHGVHEAYVATASRPMCPQKHIDQMPFGILQVVRGGVVVLQRAKPTEVSDRRLRTIFRTVAGMEPFGEAGHPNRKGIGPAQDVFDRVVEYLKANHHATWKQIFEDVPNHYSTRWSLRQSLDFVACRRGLHDWVNTVGSK